MLINIFKIYFVVTLFSFTTCERKFTPARKIKLREEVRRMFRHAYDGYLHHASDYDELRPLTCDGINTWGSYSLTLIDALDTLAVMGNFTEFRRVANLIIKKMNFDNDINVSVFETNIRIVGGLLGAHLLSRKAGMELEPGWPCNGPLLRLAEDVAKRLLPAFDTKTGMPYGTVNLKHGVPAGETSVTCTAGVGTFIIEFGALSRLTGDPIYEEVALNAIYSLWDHRSQIGLLGNHIDVQTGRWTAQDAGIGAGVDSFFEYLVKGAIMLNRPDLLEIFHEGASKIDKYMKRDDWYVWVGMNKGQVTLPVFQSLEAYWPGVLSLIGNINPAMRTLQNYHKVWRQYGFLPEFYNIPSAEAGANRESYPLRPELAESAMYLYRATKDPFLLEVGEDMIRSIEFSAKTSCGYATIKNVRDHRKENRMESFFLSETTKYLYLLFDEENFIHNDGREGLLFDTPNGMCIIEAGGYIFNTEAHPIDPSALQCCYDLPQENIYADFNLKNYNADIVLYKERLLHQEGIEKSGKYSCSDSNIYTEEKIAETVSVDIEVLDGKESAIYLANEMLSIFEKIKTESSDRQRLKPFMIKDLLQIVNNVSSVDNISAALLNFMNNYTVDTAKILNLFQNNSIDIDLSKPYTLFNLYIEQQRLQANVYVVESLNLQKFENNQSETYMMLSQIIESLNHSTEVSVDQTNYSKILAVIFKAQKKYIENMTNASAMFDFAMLFADDVKDSINELYASELIEVRNKISSVTIKTVSEINSVDTELFEKLLKIVRFKKRMIDTFQKLQSLMESSEKVDSLASDQKQLPQPGSTNNSPQANDDFFSAEIGKTNSDQKKPENSGSPSNIHFKQKIKSTSDEPTNNSILTEFVHSIIKSTLPPKPKFDEQMLLKRIRSKGIYLNKFQNYELLTCESPKFEDRFGYAAV